MLSGGGKLENELKNGYNIDEIMSYEYVKMENIPGKEAK